MRKLMIGLALLLASLAGLCRAEMTYEDALEAWADVPLATERVEVDVFAAEAENAAVSEGEIGGERALMWPGADGRLTFRFSVPQTGLYCIRVRYAQTDDTSSQIERGLLVNGETLYAESALFYFPKRFADAQYPFSKNEFGNDIRPKQTGADTPTDMTLRDRSAWYVSPLLFYFEAGENTLTLEGIKGGLMLCGLSLVPPKSTSDDTLRAPGGGEMITVEAEQIAYRSSKSIQNITVSEPSITPSQPGSKLLNALGGENWDAAGDYVEWRVQVNTAGYYSFAFDYKQSTNTSMTSYRRLEVDGETPCAAFQTVAFAYGASWQRAVPGGDEPALVYLDAGEHTVRLTCVNAPYRVLYGRLSAVVDELKNIDLRLKEIIGTDSDIYRIWKLDQYIPTLGADLTRLACEAHAIQNELNDLVGGLNLGTLAAMTGNLEQLAGHFNDIAKRSDALSEIYSAFSDWADYMSSQPITMDKFYLVPAGGSAPRVGAGFFERVSYGVSSFFKSFLNSGEDRSAQDDGSVTVWVQRNRDYVDMMQLLADEYYTPLTGVKINVTYCPPGSQLLVLANASGEQPDIVSGVDIALPFEFGIRDALVDLSKLDGFDELVSHVAQGSRIPNYFSGAEYGIAEEVRVKVMFYRTDVLARLNISVPQTWDDTVNALSTLLQNGYALFYPYGDYLTFFFQNDVDVYTPDGLSLAFTNEAGYAAFRQWTELYVKYGLQPAMSSFYQHFRIGDVPIGIADIDQFIQFDMAAPEISGQWEIALVPGTYAEDGVLVRWQAGTQTSAVMFKTTDERQARAWDFMQWWLSDDTQYLYAESMENNFGEEFRWMSANLNVVNMLAWPDNAKRVLLEQMSWYRQLPMVPGGSYMTSRELWNAWTRIVVDKGNYREEIETALEDISLEISIKQRELGYIDAKGQPLISMDLMEIARPNEGGDQP